jgi:hypothetical protein
MSSQGFVRSIATWRQQDWARAYCGFMALFALQGAVLLLLYAARGWDTDPGSFPLGLQLDPLHAAIHLATGLAGIWFAFFRPAYALPFLRGFAVFYLGLAVLGTFTRLHFGMQLELPENSLHWGLGTMAAVIAFGPQLMRAIGPRQTAERR